ncbi:pentapeptide repeat-containing protein [Microbacterium laevaniformans]|uniref:pentapeptide repeat-containing protein n=1 Tax=Microbacterium laevaniformans TaxID=36807 RepID=UPI003638C4B2
MLLFVVASFVLPRFVADLDGVSGDARVQDIASVRQAVLWIGGGLLAALTLLFTWRRDTLTRDANFTGRYTEAIAQLGDKSIAIRLGGVYALERIASDSIRDRGTILDVLAAYLRHHSPVAKDGPKRSLSVDIAAAALVLGRITQLSPPGRRIDLSRTNLRGADLSGANLRSARLGYADLSRAVLRGADLTAANMFKVDLTTADLSDARLRSARLPYSKLSGAKLIRANLRLATLRAADMTRATLVDAVLTGAHLDRADCTDANLTNANLVSADLTGANLSEAVIVGADLTGTKIDGAQLPKPPAHGLAATDG